MYSLNYQVLTKIVLVWIWVMIGFEAMDAFNWMIRTEQMYMQHPAMGTFQGYKIALAGEGALQRLPIIMGKWVGMCKFFWVGTLLAVAFFGNNRLRTFINGWNAVFLGVMSLGLYPTLDNIAAQYPKDFSNGFNSMWAMETLFCLLSALVFFIGIIAEIKRKKDAYNP
ncbi:hypothetical protein [uncultured Shewanella sp.]|uniref:hypothetical protein n=1 Tax=uncultured Shewanella sp. TaxID=173975 RepID=UPI0026270093|nr:hypothetical protein [uncultured Shewanella sp.]